MYTLRPLTDVDIPRLVEINPTFLAHTYIHVERDTSAPFAGWKLTELPLAQPFDKKTGYDFDGQEQQNIRGRYHQPNTLLEVAENALTGRLMGILDVEEEGWRKTAWIWNLMLDVEARGQGLGRKFINHTIEWARGRKLRAILLETQSNNTLACHFYARMGFRLVGVNEMFYTNHDIEDREVALFWGYSL
jgi:streptothricin acetyltransferase